METHSLQKQIGFSRDSYTAARKGDHNAFAALVSPHAPNLRRLAQRYTRNQQDADDVCQESLLKAFTKLECFSGAEQIEGCEFRAWLAKITANSAVDLLRRRKSERFVPLEECNSVQTVATCGTWGENPEATYGRQERFRLVMNAMTRLPSELRSVCVLRNLLELSTNEVAAKLGLSSVTVRVRLFRAHSELRKKLGVSSPCREDQPAKLGKNASKGARQCRNLGMQPQFESAALFASGD